jgi:hypothetical protein
MRVILVEEELLAGAERAERQWPKRKVRDKRASSFDPVVGV